MGRFSDVIIIWNICVVIVWVYFVWIYDFSMDHFSRQMMLIIMLSWTFLTLYFLCIPIISSWYIINWHVYFICWCRQKINDELNWIRSAFWCKMKIKCCIIKLETNWQTNWRQYIQMWDYRILLPWNSNFIITNFN